MAMIFRLSKHRIRLVASMMLVLGACAESGELDLEIEPRSPIFLSQSSIALYPDLAFQEFLAAAFPREEFDHQSLELYVNERDGSAAEGNMVLYTATADCSFVPLIPEEVWGNFCENTEGYFRVFGIAAQTDLAVSSSGRAGDAVSGGSSEVSCSRDQIQLVEAQLGQTLEDWTSSGARSRLHVPLPNDVLTVGYGAENFVLIVDCLKRHGQMEIAEIRILSNER